MSATNSTSVRCGDTKYWIYQQNEELCGWLKIGDSDFYYLAVFSRDGQYKMHLWIQKLLFCNNTNERHVAHSAAYWTDWPHVHNFTLAMSLKRSCTYSECCRLARHRGFWKNVRHGLTCVRFTFWGQLFIGEVDRNHRCVARIASDERNLTYRPNEVDWLIDGCSQEYSLRPMEINTYSNLEARCSRTYTYQNQTIILFRLEFTQRFELLAPSEDPLYSKNDRHWFWLLIVRQPESDIMIEM